MFDNLNVIVNVIGQINECLSSEFWVLIAGTWYNHTTFTKFYLVDVKKHVDGCFRFNPVVAGIMPYYGLFWTRSPYLDLQWRSRSTGTIPELLITSIVWHKNKNRWRGDPLWRSCELFCVGIFNESDGT